MQVIAKGASCVKIRRFHTDGSVPMQRYSCERCFVDAKAIQALAMSVDPKRTEEILDRIAGKQNAAAAAAAVPSPLPSIRRPRAWLSRMPWRVHVAMLGQVQTMFCAQLARFASNRAVSVIARHQAHAGRFDRPAGGSFSCRGPVREKPEDNTRRRER